MSLNLYNFFHLNLAYSAISEADRPCVIQKCYWPLLRLARKYDLPFSIELSGYTLGVIQQLDPSWVNELNDLISNGSCELIGSGYAQLISPLLPHQVTRQNLQIGFAEYERILGVRPNIALLNEQVFSSGLVALYVEAGYDAVIMEWNNPARAHPEWNTLWRYFPQRIKGTNNHQIPVIWNNSISFQKFQRYVHGDMDLDELIDYIRGHKTSEARALTLYGNDVEIFDFRPGRYMTEADIDNKCEWSRIEALYVALLNEPDTKFIKTSEVLGLSELDLADQVLELGSAAQPILVKKQDKYNVIRWAVSGRDDRRINTRCWRLFEMLQKDAALNDPDWKELCYLWSSDFRTHITQERWDDYQRRLGEFEKKWLRTDSQISVIKPGRSDTNIVFCRDGRFLDIKVGKLSIRLNCRKGLAVQAFHVCTVAETSVFGTLSHGYFDDIRWSADFYSGHFVFESPGNHKITDLVPVTPEIKPTEQGLEISACIKTSLGDVFKTWNVNEVTRNVSLTYKFNWSGPVVGSLRLGYVTLNPEAFDEGNLDYQTHNGGDLETFTMSEIIQHGKPLSSLISATQAVGMTEGLIALGDAQKQINMRIDKKQQALIGMVMHQTVDGKKFTRMFLSALEHDDTSKPLVLDPFEVEIWYSVEPRNARSNLLP